MATNSLIDEFISGHYSVTYNAVDLGVTLDGVTFSMEIDAVEVRSDRFGSQVIDRIFQGVRTATIRFGALQQTALKRNQLLQLFSAGSAMGNLFKPAGHLLHAGETVKALAITRLNNTTVLPAAPTGFITYTFWAFPSGNWVNRLNTNQVQLWDATFDIYPTLPGGNLPTTETLVSNVEPRWFVVDGV